MRVALLRAACRSAGRRCLSSAPLAALRAAELAHSTAKLDLDIADADAGGHALLGRNGSGKSIIGRALGGAAHIKSGSLDRPARTAHVSFEAHEALAKEDVTVYEALGKLQTKASKYLAVRFGLHPLLWRPVRAVSTGEIRKVLLARALAARPTSSCSTTPSTGWTRRPGRLSRSCCRRCRAAGATSSSETCRRPRRPRGRSSSRSRTALLKFCPR